MFGIRRPKSVPKALLCWLILIAFLLAVLLPAARWVSQYREMARRGNCKARLRAIGLGVIMYANDFSGHLPPNLGLLAPKYVDERSFICPSTKEYGGICSELPCFRERRLPPDDGSYRYEYPGVPFDKVVTPPEKTILMYDKPRNHRDGANVLFLDGHLEWREGFLRPD